MGLNTEIIASQCDPDLKTVNGLIEKLTVRQLHLMEQKITCELNIESCINNGSIHLAKSRYIMGQSSVSSSRLPTEATAEFPAGIMCEHNDHDGMKQLKLIRQQEKSSNPLRWFGVLVPRNMHKAQSMFQDAVNYVMDCVNVQLLLHDNMKSLNVLNEYKENIVMTR